MQSTGSQKSTKPKTLLASTLLISCFTLLSRISGMVRDQVVAYYFGAGAATDAFNVAFRIPNLFRRFFGEGSLNQAFVPVLSEYKLRETQQTLKQFIAEMTGTLGLVLLALTILGVIFSPQIISVFASGFADEPEKFKMSSDLLQIMFPYVFFMCLAALMSSVLNTMGQFAVPAMTPILLNLCMIALALCNAQFTPPITALGFGVLIAGFLQLALPTLFVAKQNLLKLPQLGFHSKGVKRVIYLMIPAIIGSSSSQINILINTWLASTLQTGSITWLYYSDRLVEFVLGSVAVAIGTVVLPHLSKLHTDNNHVEYAKTINWSFTVALVVGIPSSVGLIFMAKPLLSVFFMRGAFHLNDVLMTSRSLITYSLSICAFFIIKVFAPIYYSRKNTKTPMQFSLCAIAVNIVLQMILVNYLAHAGLALSSSIAAWINALLLIAGLKYYGIHPISSLFNKSLLAVIPANLGLAAFLYWAQSYQDFWLHASISWRIFALTAVISISISGYFAALHFMGFHLRNLKSPKGF